MILPSACPSRNLNRGQTNVDILSSGFHTVSQSRRLRRLDQDRIRVSLLPLRLPIEG